LPLQDRLSKEEAEWQHLRAMQEEQIDGQKKQLLKLQEQVKSTSQFNLQKACPNVVKQ
jgi:hypothetical protein